MADPLNGLITNGLGVDLPADAMIITATTFTLGPVNISVPVIGTGGSIPLQPGQVQDFYKPVDQVNLQPKQEPFYTPYQVPVKKKVVKITLKFGEKEIEKEYSVREDKLKIIIKVLNFVNRVKSGISMQVRNLKRIATKASVKILRFRKRD